LPANQSIWTKTFIQAFIANCILFFIFHSFSLLPLLIKESGGSDFQIGIIMGIFTFVALPFRPISGIIADKLGHRTMALFGTFILIISLSLFSKIEAMGLGIVALRALMGFAWCFIISSLTAIALSETPSKRHSEAIGLFGLSGLVAQGFAPMICQKLLPILGLSLFYYVDAALCLVSFFLIFGLPSKSNPIVQHCSPPNTKPILLSLVGTLILISCYAAAKVTTFHFLAPYCDSLGLTAFGFYFFAFTITAFITQWKLAKLSDGLGYRKMAVISATALALHCLILASASSNITLVLAAILGGLGQGILYPTLCAIILAKFSAKSTAFALSTYAFFFDVGATIALPSFGLLADAYNYRLMFAALCITLLCAAVLFYLLQQGNISSVRFKIKAMFSN
jgi:MFS family permease